MKKDWMAAICAFPSILLDVLVNGAIEIEREEKEVLNGAEYDPEQEAF